MSWKRKFSKNGLLYVILDKNVVDKVKGDIFSLADKLARCGVDLLQLRVKDICDKELLFLARQLSKIIHQRKKLFIVNDRADIAFLSGANGLHLGEKDISADQARKLLGKKAIIGRTIHHHNKIKDTLTGTGTQRGTGIKEKEIDYISIGPVFKTQTKPHLKPLTSKKLKMMMSKSKKLVFAIGGINLYNINLLLKSGIKNVAVCRDILEAKNLKTTLGEYKKCLKRIS